MASRSEHGSVNEPPVL